MEMTGNSFKFGLDIIDHVIVEALRQALENVMPDIMIDNNLQERNGYGQFRWNAIIAQLREKCQHLGWLDLGICKRGAWKTPVLFHPASRNLFTLMTREHLWKSNAERKRASIICAGEQAIIIIYSPKWNKCKWTCHLLSELQRNG